MHFSSKQWKSLKFTPIKVNDKDKDADYLLWVKNIKNVDKVYV